MLWNKKSLFAEALHLKDDLTIYGTVNTNKVQLLYEKCYCQYVINTS